MIGSPFQYTVGRSTAGGAHKVDFGGVGVDKAQVGAKSKQPHLSVFRHFLNINDNDLTSGTDTEFRLAW